MADTVTASVLGLARSLCAAGRLGGRVGEAGMRLGWLIIGTLLALDLAAHVSGRTLIRAWLAAEAEWEAGKVVCLHRDPGDLPLWWEHDGGPRYEVEID